MSKKKVFNWEQNLGYYTTPSNRDALPIFKTKTGRNFKELPFMHKMQLLISGQFDKIDSNTGMPLPKYGSAKDWLLGPKGDPTRTIVEKGVVPLAKGIIKDRVNRGKMFISAAKVTGKAIKNAHDSITYDIPLSNEVGYSVTKKDAPSVRNQLKLDKAEKDKETIEALHDSKTDLKIQKTETPKVEVENTEIPYDVKKGLTWN
tara:strand:- start:155 stop:763 length:609 start_codon:yes stop_codon:yes gene_type:complete